MMSEFAAERLKGKYHLKKVPRARRVAAIAMIRNPEASVEQVVDHFRDEDDAPRIDADDAYGALSLLIEEQAEEIPADADEILADCTDKQTACIRWMAENNQHRYSPGMMTLREMRDEVDDEYGVETSTGMMSYVADNNQEPLARYWLHMICHRSDELEGTGTEDYDPREWGIKQLLDFVGIAPLLTVLGVPHPEENSEIGVDATEDEMAEIVGADAPDPAGLRDDGDNDSDDTVPAGADDTETAAPAEPDDATPPAAENAISESDIEEMIDEALETFTGTNGDTPAETETETDTGGAEPAIKPTRVEPAVPESYGLPEPFDIVGERLLKESKAATNVSISTERSPGEREITIAYEVEE